MNAKVPVPEVEKREPAVKVKIENLIETEGEKLEKEIDIYVDMIDQTEEVRQSVGSIAKGKKKKKAKKAKKKNDQMSPVAEAESPVDLERPRFKRLAIPEGAQE